MSNYKARKPQSNPPLKVQTVETNASGGEQRVVYLSNSLVKASERALNSSKQAGANTAIQCPSS